MSLSERLKQFKSTLSKVEFLGKEGALKALDQFIEEAGKETMIPIERLSNIADYYEFPMAVFFMNAELKGKRKNQIGKSLRELEEKLIDVIHEYL